MNKLVSISTYLVIFASVVIASDYCDSSLCRSGVHIGCDNNGEISPECADSAEFIDLNYMKDKILDQHNKYRNEIASGNVKHLNPATRMATMKWDDELAKLAGFNVKTCNSEHDDCHNTEQYKYSGQNLAYYSTSGTPDIEQVILDGITSWYNENKDVDMSIIDSYRSISGTQVGHFTEMVNDRNTAVGCSALKKLEGGDTTVLLACNYATNNIRDRKIYSAGPTASECTLGPNSMYSGLCDLNEPIDPNNI